MGVEPVETLLGELGGLLAQRRYDEALAAVDELLRLRPDDPAILAQRGVVLQLLGRLDEAVDAWRGALERQPEEATAQAGLQRLEATEQAVDRRHDAAAHLLAEARRARGANDLEGALGRGRAALALHPDHPPLLVFLAETLIRLHALDEARALLDEALALAPDDPAAQEARQRLDHPPPPDPFDRLGAWRSDGWALGREDLWAWLLLDSTALTVLALPPLVIWIVSALWAVGLAAPRSDPASLLAAWPGGWPGMVFSAVLTKLWAFIAGGVLVSGRLLLMARKVWHGEFEGRFAGRGFALFGRAWWQLLLLVLVVWGLALALASTVVLLPVWLFAVSALAFAGPLVLLGGRDAFAACSESYLRLRGAWASWLGLLLATGLLPLLLGVLSIVVPVMLVVRAWNAGNLAIVLAIGGALCVHLVLFVIAWLAAHAGSMAWMVAYRETYGDGGLAGAAEVLGDGGRGTGDGTETATAP